MSGSDVSPSRPKPIGMLIVALAVIGFLAYTGFNLFRSGRSQEAVVDAKKVHPVRVADARVMALTQQLELTGEVRPWREVMVFAKVPGQRIHFLTVQKGDRVTDGQILARLDEDTIRAKLKEARSAVAAGEAATARAAASLAVLEKDRERFEALYRENAIARRQLDHLVAQKEEAEAARAMARAQAQQARAVIEQLTLTLADHRIRAPMDGVVTGRFIDPGNLSSIDRPLLQLADLSRIKIISFVTEQDLPNIRPGIAARVHVDAYPEKTFEGVVSVVNAALSPATRSADIEVHLDNPQGWLQPGMYARLTLTTGQADAVMVDRDAVVRMPGTGSEFVFTVEDQRAVQVNVTTGRRQGRRVEVRAGISAGTPVVVEGQGALRHDDPVRIVGGADRSGEGRDE